MLMHGQICVWHDSEEEGDKLEQEFGPTPNTQENDWNNRWPARYAGWHSRHGGERAQQKALQSFEPQQGLPAGDTKAVKTGDMLKVETSSNGWVRCPNLSKSSREGWVPDWVLQHPDTEVEPVDLLTTLRLNNRTCWPSTPVGMGKWPPWMVEAKLCFDKYKQLQCQPFAIVSIHDTTAIGIGPNKESYLYQRAELGIADCFWASHAVSLGFPRSV